MRAGRCAETLLPARKAWVDFWFLPRELWAGYVSLAGRMQRFGAFFEWELAVKSFENTRIAKSICPSIT